MPTLQPVLQRSTIVSHWYNTHKPRACNTARACGRWRVHFVEAPRTPTPSSFLQFTLELKRGSPILEFLSQVLFTRELWPSFTLTSALQPASQLEITENSNGPTVPSAAPCSNSPRAMRFSFLELISSLPQGVSMTSWQTCCLRLHGESPGK
jgi:hypothetical protein